MEEQAIKAAEQVSGQQEAAGNHASGRWGTGNASSHPFSPGQIWRWLMKNTKKTEAAEENREIARRSVSEKVPVVIGFEGWDAGGKGGAIKRLTEKMDQEGMW